MIITDLLRFILALHLLDRGAELLGHSLAGWKVHRGAAPADVK